MEFSYYYSQVLTIYLEVSSGLKIYLNKSKSESSKSLGFNLKGPVLILDPIFNIACPFPNFNFKPHLTRILFYMDYGAT